MITLFEEESDAESYRVRILLALLHLDYSSVAIEEYVLDDPDAAAPAVVVLVDGTVNPSATVHDSVAALLYLCRTYDPSGRFLGGPQPARQAAALDWLATARELSASAGAARRAEAFGAPCADLAGARATAHRILQVMDRSLWFGEQQGDGFLAGALSLADLACFGDVVLSEEGGVSRSDYPAVRRWCDRVKRVPGLPLMSGIFPAAPERVA